MQFISKFFIFSILTLLNDCANVQLFNSSAEEHCYYTAPFTISKAKISLNYNEGGRLYENVVIEPR
jgi:hypothetical protein